MNITENSINNMAKDSELYIGCFVPVTEDCEIHIKAKKDAFGQVDFIGVTATNNTIFKTYFMPYDNCFSIDENQQQFFEQIN